MNEFDKIFMERETEAHHEREEWDVEEFLATTPVVPPKSNAPQGLSDDEHVDEFLSSLQERRKIVEEREEKIQQATADQGSIGPSDGKMAHFKAVQSDINELAGDGIPQSDVGKEVTRARKNLGAVASELLDAPGDMAQGVADVARGMKQTIEGVSADLEEMGIPVQEFRKAVSTYGAPFRTVIPGMPYLPVTIAEQQMLGRIIDAVPDDPSRKNRPVRLMARFLTGLALTKGVTGAGLPIKAIAQMNKAKLGGHVAGTVLAGNLNASLTQLWAMGEDQNLINFVQELGVPENEFLEFLDYDEDNSSVRNRLNAAVVDLGFGVVGEAAIRGIMAIKAVRSMRRALFGTGVDKVKALKPTLDDQARQAKVTRQKLVELLGDPTKPLLRATKKGATAGSAGSKGVKTVLTTDVSDVAEDIAHSVAGRSRWTHTLPDELSDEFNWARIDGPDDVKRVLDDLARGVKSETAETVGGPRTLRAVEKDAADLDVFDMLVRERRASSPGLPDLTIEQEQAARMLHAASGAKLESVARLYEKTNDEVVLAAFNKMVDTHRIIQMEVKAARATASRRLGSWRVPVKSDGYMLVSELDDILESSGSNYVNKALAKTIAKHSREGGDGAFIASELLSNLPGLAKLAKHSPKIAPLFRKYYYFAMLSGIPTHARNLLSGFGHLGMKMSERGFAAILGKTIVRPGEVGSVAPGEFIQYAYGAMKGFRDAFRLGEIHKAFGDVMQGNVDDVAKHLGRASSGQFTDALDGGVYAAFKRGSSSMGGDKVGREVLSDLSPEVMGYDPSSNFGRVFRGVDSLLSKPQQSLAAGDELVKTMFYRAEGQALAYRQATAELTSGSLTQAGFANRVRELVSDPTDIMQATMVRQAQEGTFTQLMGNGATANIFRAVGRWPVAGKLLLPFQTTPYNIAWEGLRRSPFAVGMPSFLQEITSSNPATVQLAWSRFLMGNATILGLLDLFIDADKEQIRIQGDTPPDADFDRGQQLRRMGLDDMRMDIAIDASKGMDGGFVSIPFRGLDPMAGPFGIVANLITMLESDAFDEDDVNQNDLMLAIGGAVATQFMSMNMLQSVSDAFESLSPENRMDPKRGIAAFVKRSLSGMASPRATAQFVPVVDDTYREIFDEFDRIKSQTPWFSKELGVSYDALGRARKRKVNGWGAMFSTVVPSIVHEEREPLDMWLEANNEVIVRPPKTSMEVRKNVEFSWANHKKLYSEYVRLYGDGLKEPHLEEEYILAQELDYVRVNPPPEGFEPMGVGFREEMNHFVNGTHDMQYLWDTLEDGEDGTRVRFMRQLLSHYKMVAREKLLSKPSESDPLYAEKTALRADLKPKLEEAKMQLPNSDVMGKLHLTLDY